MQFCFPLSCFMQQVCNTTQYEMWDLILRSILSIPSNSDKGIWCQEMIIASKKRIENTVIDLDKGDGGYLAHWYIEEGELAEGEKGGEAGVVPGQSWQYFPLRN